MARPNVKSHKPTYHRSKSFKARQRAARAAQKVKPRRALKTTPGSAPNTYNFKRTYDHPFLLGSTQGGVDSAFSLNADGKFQIMQFHTKFKYLPKFDQFKDVFSQYKITSITHRMVPYYSGQYQCLLRSLPHMPLVRSKTWLSQFSVIYNNSQWRSP